ncbi:hypothetical protein [Arenimonas caeni]|uniref:Uncharacterized protein n=1 Tax=Arenimonas caeni TaxID=2058085 RepID=A0A2P6M9E2_9GAMM|nr:hypothetical protein [Arenimonas caeni]PRH82610.1 hypothetical protein C6N40_06455 [Arenimonas caeni]
MKLWLGWILVHGVLVASLWTGFVDDVEGAARIGLFVCWVLIVLSFFAHSDRVQAKADQDPVPTWLNVVVDVLVLLFLVWHDAVVTAAFWLLHIGLWLSARETRKASERTPR